jgi:hypothetical protein
MSDHNDRSNLDGADELAKIGREALQPIRSRSVARFAAPAKIDGHRMNVWPERIDYLPPNGTVGSPAVNE